MRFDRKNRQTGQRAQMDNRGRIICVFYDRAQLDHAKAIARLLRNQGNDPWLADESTIRDWRSELTSKLNDPLCFGSVAIWSEQSVQNRIVIEEADATLRAGRHLLGVVLDDASPPIGFASGPRVLVKKWDGSDNGALQNIWDRIERLQQASERDTKRVNETVLGGRRVFLPCFVFSVSSFETQISPARTLELLKLFTPPAILLSAYDVLGTTSAEPDITPSQTLLDELTSKDTTVFLDSGNYEAYRRDDAFWQRSPWLLREATSRLKCNVIFCHDRIHDVESLGDIRVEGIASQIVADVGRDCAATGRDDVSPIVHAPRLNDGTFASRFLPELCAQVAVQRRPPLIAVAERELGDGILERARRIFLIRQALDRLDFKQTLHVLGTGNPLSIMILALAGGDIFDGLEWCRTVADGDTMRLHHFHHFDLFVSQRRKIRDEFLLQYLTTKDEVLTAKAKAVLHNLFFFKQFSEQLQLAHQQGGYEELFERYLPGEFGRIRRRIQMAEQL